MSAPAVVDGAATVDGAAVVDGVDVDAVAGAVRSRPAVAYLHGGGPGEIATYLPRRRVVGVRVAPDAVLVAVCARWEVPAVELAAQIRRAVVPLAPKRRIDIVVAELTDPPLPTAAVDGEPCGPVRRLRG